LSCFDDINNSGGIAFSCGARDGEVGLWCCHRWREM
jgi:hypothetical protein